MKGHPVAAVAAVSRGDRQAGAGPDQGRLQGAAARHRRRRGDEARRADPARPPADRGRQSAGHQAVEHRQAHRVQEGRRQGGLRPGRGGDREGLHHAGRAPGLYRAARHPGVRRRGRPGPGLVDDPGPLPGAWLLRPAARPRYLADPRDADRDRRRLRRQDRGLSRASGHSAQPEVGQAGEDDDGARGRVPRLRPRAGRQRQGQDRRHQGRPHRRRRVHRRDAGGRLPGLAGGSGLHVQLRLLRHRQRLHRGLRCREQPAQGRGLSRARRADLGVGRRVDARHPGPAARHGSDRSAPEERRQGGHQDGLWRHLQHHRHGRDAAGDQGLRRTTSRRSSRATPAAWPPASGSTSAPIPAPPAMSARTAR